MSMQQPMAGVSPKCLMQSATTSGVDGGENWFDISTVVEFLLSTGSRVDLIVTPLDGKEVRNIAVNLDGLPNRPDKTTRLRMSVSFTLGDTVKIVIEDLGFGEIFPSSGMKWEKEVRIV